MLFVEYSKDKYQVERLEHYLLDIPQINIKWSGSRISSAEYSQDKYQVEQLKNIIC